MAVKATVTLIVIGIGVWLRGCGRVDTERRLELAVRIFYYTYDPDPLPFIGSRTRWVLIEAPGPLGIALSYGDTLSVGFKVGEEKLVPVATAMAREQLSECDYIVMGRYIDSVAGASTVRVGFPLKISRRDYELTRYDPDSVYLANAFFIPCSDKRLEFAALRVTGRLAGKPLRFK